MKRFLTVFWVLAAVMSVYGRTITITVKDKTYQTITGFGAACCDGAMCPLGTDTQPVRLLYGPTSKIGLNIMRMEISPNYVGDIVVPEWGNWDSPYDWKGSLPSAKYVKNHGGIVFGTPWSPPGDLKTNGTAQGGNSDKQNDNLNYQYGFFVIHYRWTTSPYAAAAASMMASDIVGCGKMFSIMSRPSAPSSRASTAVATISVTFSPTMW